MIAKIIAHGRDRDEALARLRRALAETHRRRSAAARPTGLPARSCSTAPRSRRGELDTGWLDRLTAAGDAPAARRHADVALLQAAIEVYEAERGDRARGFYAVGGARAARGATARSATASSCATAGSAYRFEVRQPRPAGATASQVDGRTIDVARRALGRLRALAHLWPAGATASSPSPRARRASRRGRRRAAPHRARRRRLVRAPAPAIVVVDRGAAGRRVAAGDRVAVLEA